ncbi:MAG: carboxypeptidase regulatory-like domain-containing protein [Planctomycetes bacterium]|nr:carboxypeptidase regulatory-like domain-containing protein [Planctomycetota bacterium]
MKRWIFASLFTLLLAALFMRTFRSEPPRRQKPAVEAPRVQPEAHPAAAASPPRPPEPALKSEIPSPPAPAEEEDPGKTYTLRGLVLDRGKDSQPLPGAQIRINNSEEAGFDPRTFSTDASGRFQVDGLLKGSHHLAAWSPRHRYQSERVKVPFEGELVFRLEPAPHVEGRAFLRDRSQPLAEASIQLSEANAIRTDGDGWFCLGPLQHEEYIFTFLCAPWRTVSLTADLRTEDSQSLEVIFTDGVTAAGTIQNQQGLPLPRAGARWARPNSHPSTALPCQADDLGRYERAGLEPGAYFVLVEGIGEEGPRRAEVLLSAATVQNVPIIIDCPPPLRVKVESQAGEPVEGAEVRYQYELPRQSGNHCSEPTDAQGWTYIHCVPPETPLNLRADAGDLGAAKAVAYQTSLFNEPVILRLSGVETLHGEVLSFEGKPAHGAEVSVRGISFQVRRSADADRDGRFSMALPPGYYEVEVQGYAGGAAFLEPLVIKAGRTPDFLRFLLKKKGPIQVQVFNPDGSPCENAVVVLRSQALTGLSRKGYSDEEGRASFEVMEGRYSVNATARKESFELTLPAPVTGVAPGGPPVEIRLHDPWLCRLSGTVYQDGQPVSNAQVAYYRVKSGEWVGPEAGVARSDRAGNFEFAAAQEQQIFVLAWAPGFAMARSEPIEVPERAELRGIAVTALSGPDLEIQVRDLAGSPVPEAIVNVYLDEAPPFAFRGRAGLAGSLRVARLPTGKYQVHAESIDRRFSLDAVIAWEGSAQPQVLDLRPAR